MRNQSVPPDAPDKVDQQIAKARLPQSGQVAFIPKLKINDRGEQEIAKAKPRYGPKRGKKGYLDTEARIWIKERAHSGQPDHWDVQIDEGQHYIKVDFDGNLI